jgi:hypothetical protein
MAQVYRANNMAFQARWHRQLAADLSAIGRDIEARDHEQRAQMCESALRGNHQCSACGRPLTDVESLHLGMGPECRRKHGGVVAVA